MSELNATNVLVVDDEPSIRELLLDAMRDEPIGVQAAGSGKEAIDRALDATPDLIVTDLLLGDCTGLDVLDGLADRGMTPPAVVITGHRDPGWLSEASRRRPVELITKPLDLDRLLGTVRQELRRQQSDRVQSRRTRKLRHLARQANNERRAAEQRLQETCSDLTEAYRTLSGRLSMQEIVLNFQNEMIGARVDDDVFRSLFRTFVRRSGPVFGISLVCDANAQLRIVGRFGVPHPDSLTFCQRLAEPLVDDLLANPQTLRIDLTEETGRFDESVRKYLCGINVLAVPLIPSAGELIGVVVFYRKGEQPFTEFDAGLAEMVATPTAVAIRRND